MNKTLRYFLILLTIIAFVVLAPAVVLFVSGVKIDWRKQNYEQTGILVALTQPSGAEVWLNQKKQSSTPATLRFLTPGNYNLLVKKEGYFDWQKSLAVEPNRISYNYEGVDAVQLIKQPNESIITTDQVSDMVFTNGHVWYASQNEIKVLTPQGEPSHSAQMKLSFVPTRLYVMNDDEYILASNDADRKAVINTRTKNVMELPLGFTGSAEVWITPDGEVLTLREQVLYLFNPAQKTVTSIAKNLLGFTLLGNTGYFATGSNNFTLDTRKWANNTFGNPEVLTATSLPAKPAQLIITKNKQLFTLLNKELFRINEQPELVSDGVTQVRLDPQTQELTFITSNELWFYNFLANRPQLLTRIAEKINQFTVRSSIGYGFIAKADGLWAWEIDARSNQNQYPLFRGAVTDLAIDSEIKYLYALRDGKLSATLIR